MDGGEKVGRKREGWAGEVEGRGGHTRLGKSDLGTLMSAIGRQKESKDYKLKHFLKTSFLFKHCSTECLKVCL